LPLDLAQLTHDPVFKVALADPEFRKRLQDPDFQDAMRDPRVRREVRAHYSERVYPLPTEAVIDRLEAELNGKPCIGSLSAWFRKYTNGGDVHRGGVDPNMLEFSLHEAGKFEFKPGRTIVPTSDFPVLDDRAYKYASGSYDIRSSKLVVETCGSNVED
jgi:hypothetical protein